MRLRVYPFVFATLAAHIIGCGPTAEEQATFEKARNDSINQLIEAARADGEQVGRVRAIMEAKERSPEELRADLLANEVSKPLNHLTVEADWNSPLLGPDYIWTVVRNDASVATFKDIRLAIEYYSKTGTLMKADEHTIYEFIGPGGETAFNLRPNPPDEHAGFRVRVIRADVARGPVD